MTYLVVKTIHILSLVLLFGTGFGSAFYKYMTDRTGDVRAIAVTNRNVVTADWLFTTPTIILQPITGYWLSQQSGIQEMAPWLVFSLVLYSVAGACWLPVVVLQIRMRDLSSRAAELALPLPAVYSYYARIWFWLGVPAFAAMVAIVCLMVLKPLL